MPGTDGFQFAYPVRQDPVLGKVPMYLAHLANWALVYVILRKFGHGTSAALFGAAFRGGLGSFRGASGGSVRPRNAVRVGPLPHRVGFAHKVGKINRLSSAAE